MTSRLKFLRAVPGLLGIGIDEDTAIEVHGQVARALGHGNVTVLDGRPASAKPVAPQAGARYDLRRRVVL